MNIIVYYSILYLSMHSFSDVSNLQILINNNQIFTERPRTVEKRFINDIPIFVYNNKYVAVVDDKIYKVGYFNHLIEVLTCPNLNDAKKAIIAIEYKMAKKSETACINLILNCKSNNSRRRYLEKKKVKHTARLKMLEEMETYLDSI